MFRKTCTNVTAKTTTFFDTVSIKNHIKTWLNFTDMFRIECSTSKDFNICIRTFDFSFHVRKPFKILTVERYIFCCSSSTILNSFALTDFDYWSFVWIILVACLLIQFVKILQLNVKIRNEIVHSNGIQFTTFLIFFLSLIQSHDQ